MTIKKDRVICFWKTRSQHLDVTLAEFMRFGIIIRLGRLAIAALLGCVCLSLIGMHINANVREFGDTMTWLAEKLTAPCVILSFISFVCCFVYFALCQHNDVTDLWREMRREYREFKKLFGTTSPLRHMRGRYMVAESMVKQAVAIERGKEQNGDSTRRWQLRLMLETASRFFNDSDNKSEWLPDYPALFAQATHILKAKEGK